jgi:DNA polymerase delta subunit 2
MTNESAGSYPFQDDDPFVMNSCPHVFFVGSQPKFDTAEIEGPEGQTVRLIAVPKFAETREIVLLDSETLEASVVSFTVS